MSVLICFWGRAESIQLPLPSSWCHQSVNHMHYKNASTWYFSLMEHRLLLQRVPTDCLCSFHSEFTVMTGDIFTGCMQYLEESLSNGLLYIPSVPYSRLLPTNCIPILRFGTKGESSSLPVVLQVLLYACCFISFSCDGLCVPTGGILLTQIGCNQYVFRC